MNEANATSLFPYTMRDILSHHDVVFRTPVHDPLYGLPIGAKGGGCLLWLTEDALKMQINRTDLWDMADCEEDTFCSMEDENLTTCRSGVQLTLDFHCPVFAPIYQKRFSSRLSLYDAEAQIETETPFCHMTCRAFSLDTATTVLRIRTEYSAETTSALTMERWGSRTFFFWYDHFTPNTEKGLSGTDAEINHTGNMLIITQELHGKCFCATMKIVPQHESANATLSLRGKHGVQCDFSAGRVCEAELYIALEVGDTVEEAREKAMRRASEAADQGFDTLFMTHAKSWASFWEKSAVSLHEDENSDFLENLWYLNLYYANCAKGGESPEHFCNGPWDFYHDFVPWNHFFHYNMQLSTFPLEAADHGELLDTYYDFRIQQLPIAKRYAAQIKNTDGAFYADVCDGYGRQDSSGGVRNNCTCGAQIAMSLYRHYLYSGDETYLREKALPVMMECARLYLSLLTTDTEGIYHIHGTTTYEGSPLFDDSLTDLTMIRTLFSALVRVLPEMEAEVYAHVLEKLPPYHTTKMDEDEVSNGVYLRGIGKGMQVYGDKVLCVGKRCGDGIWMRRTFGNPGKDYYGFPDIEMAPVFPAGLVGIKERGTELYNEIANSICLHHPNTPENNPYGESAADGICMGWCMMPIYLARMGMTELLHKHMRDTVSTWITYPQGFGQYGPYANTAEDVYLRWHTHAVRNTVTGEKTNVFMWNFRHFNNETLPILAATVNEMLLQSHDGILRLFCAVKQTGTVAFRLLAQGGFFVEAIYQKGNCQGEITSRRGGILRIAFENVPGQPVFERADGTKMSAQREGEVYYIETQVSERIYIHAGDAAMYNKEYLRNTDKKTLGNASLGWGREFGE